MRQGNYRWGGGFLVEKHTLTCTHVDTHVRAPQPARLGQPPHHFLDCMETVELVNPQIMPMAFCVPCISSIRSFRCFAGIGGDGGLGGLGPQLGPQGHRRRAVILGLPSQHLHTLDLLHTLPASFTAASFSVSPSLSHPSQQQSGDHWSSWDWLEVTMYPLFKAQA